MSGPENGHEAVEQLIPWYANGAIEPDERRRVDGHTRRCEACRELLEQALDQAALLRYTSPEAIVDTVHPRLLTEYVEAPDTLDAQTREWIDGKLAEGGPSSGAHHHLRSSLSPGAPDEQVATASLWTRLLGLVPRPVPAFAFVLLLAVLLPAAWRMGRRSGALPTVAPRVYRVSGDRVVRDETTAAANPLRIAPVAPGGSVLLQLETRLLPADLRALDARFRIELRRGDSVVWSSPIATEQLDFSTGVASLTVVLQPAWLASGEVHELALVADKPGDPVHGQALFPQVVAVARKLRALVESPSIGAPAGCRLVPEHGPL